MDTLIGQNLAVLQFLRRKPITTLDAFRMGITRLSARIYDLRKAGYRILAQRVVVRSRWGKTVVCRYCLEDSFNGRALQKKSV